MSPLLISTPLRPCDDREEGLAVLFDEAVPDDVTPPGTRFLTSA